MDPSAAKSLPELGFLAVVEHSQHGLFGGYLVLNHGGRPLEFHCTAPVKPNRAQEILYGPTLKPYLYGEQIGKTLLDRAKTLPSVVLTDSPPALALREVIEAPLALIGESDGVLASEAAGPSGALCCFELLGHQAAVEQRFVSDRERLTTLLAPVAQSIDLAEPFFRIREAIEEANRAA